MRGVGPGWKSGPVHHIERLDHTSDPDLLRGWLEAIQLGFHEGRTSDEARQIFLAGIERDRSILLAVRDPDHPDDPRPVATFSGFDKTANVGGPEPLGVHMITDVTVRPTHRRRGLLRAMMTGALDEAVQRGLPLAALTVSEAGIYGRFGFGVTTQTQRLEVNTSAKFQLLDPTPAAGSVRMLQPDAALADMNAVFADFHATTPGSLDRPNHYQAMLSGAFDWEENGPNKKLRAAVHRDPDGRPDGYVTYAVGFPEDKPGTVTTHGFLTTTPEAYRGLWQFLAAIDLTERVVIGGLAMDDPLADMLTDRRCARPMGSRDAVWFRILDPVAALEGRRWITPGAITLGITDDLGHADGTFTVDSDGERATVRRSEATPEVAMSVDTLAMAYLGGSPIRQLVAAGRVRGSTEALDRLARLFVTDRPPFGATFF